LTWATFSTTKSSRASLPSRFSRTVRDTRRAVLETVTHHVEANLWSEAGNAARVYLHERGFSDDGIRDLRLGLHLSADAVSALLRSKGFDRADIAESGVVARRLEGYIIFPWNDEHGRPLTLYGTWSSRTPPDGKPKKLALPNPRNNGKDWESTKRSPLYLDRARKAGHKEAVLVEGLTDAGIAQQRGDTRVIACVAAALSRLQVETLARCGIRGVTIALDPDAAGDNGIRSCVRGLIAKGITPYVAPKLPDGLDPDDFIVQHGVDAWRQHVDQAVHAYRYEARGIIARHKPASGWTDKTKDSAIAEAGQFAAAQPDDRRGDLDLYFWPEIWTGASIPSEIHGDAWEGDDDPAPRQPAYAPKLWTSSEFFAQNFRRDYYVNGVLAVGQPSVIGGPQKTLKSGNAIDLAVSLDTATEYLGHFRVPRRVQVLLLNGESGESTMQETAARIAKSKGIEPNRMGIIWGSELPRLANADHLSDFAGILSGRKIEVVIVDPVYLCLLAGAGPDGPNPANAFEMGALYSDVARACLDAGATPVLSVHAKRHRENKPLELDDLLYAGIAEFARQWILLNRRELYEGDGVHRLWLNIGGSAGHTFLGHLDIAEGLTSDPGGRKWDVAVTPFGEAKRERKAERDHAKTGQKQADELAVMDIIDRIVGEGQHAILRRIRDGAGISRERVDCALERLRLAKTIMLKTVKVEGGHGAKQDASAYVRRPD
jgi:hypothetical protein